MGILNVTPDSFYDGGRYPSVQKALRQAKRMIKEGADILDLGGESTRPGSKSVSEKDELRRVLPVLRAIRQVFPKIPLSVDTRKSAVAQAALDEGATIINDVSALEFDPQMTQLILRRKPHVVLMHMKGEPGTMQAQAKYRNVIDEIKKNLFKKVRGLVRKGFPKSKIIVDPGLGFGKTSEHNLQILKHLHRFKSLGCAVLVGASRKSFIGKILSTNGSPLPPEERLEGSLATALWATFKGTNILRVHDVGATRRALSVWHSISAAKQVAHEY